MARIAKPVEYIITDDLTGEEGAESRSFILGNVEYHIDLNDENNHKLEMVLNYIMPFIDAAHRTQGNTSRVADRPQTYRDRNALIWADYNGTGPGSWTSSLAVKYGLSEQSINLIVKAARMGNFGSTQTLR